MLKHESETENNIFAFSDLTKAPFIFIYLLKNLYWLNYIVVLHPLQQVVVSFIRISRKKKICKWLVICAVEIQPVTSVISVLVNNGLVYQSALVVIDYL